MSNNLMLQSIKKCLERVVINTKGESLVNSGLLADVLVSDNQIDIIIEFPNEMTLDQQNIQKQIEGVLQQDFSKNIRVIFSSKREGQPYNSASSLANEVRPGISGDSLAYPRSSAPSVPPSGMTQQAGMTQQGKLKQKVPNVKKIILMASAKGGVGKSTTAVNVAIALANQGFAVGVVDADIYGPTMPKLLGIKQKPDTEDGKMLPIKKNNIYSISIGYIVDEAQAAIWRGPMVSKALYQLLLGVKWPNLDYLIVDMPPGTGDIYLSLADNFVIDGAVLVSTPQNIALTMVKKSISFFNKMNIPILGIIENMSYFFDVKNNIKHNIFGESITEKMTGCKLLGNIPIIPKISQFSDKGMSLLEEEEFKIYHEISNNLIRAQ